MENTEDQKSVNEGQELPTQPAECLAATEAADGVAGQPAYRHYCSLCDDAPCHLLRDVHTSLREVPIYESDGREADAIVVYMRCLEAVGIDTAREAEHVRQIMRDAIEKSPIPPRKRGRRWSDAQE